MAAAGPSGRDRPGVPSVVFATLPAAAPMVVLAAVIPLTYAHTGSIGLPLAFAGLGLVLLLFSVGYLTMSRHIPNTGSLYAYVAQGLGRPLGLGAAWVAVLAYSAVQISLYGLVGATANLWLDRAFGLHVQWWIAALVGWALVTGVGTSRRRVPGLIVALLVCLEMIAVVGFAVVAASQPGTDGVSLTQLDPDLMLAAGFGAALVPALLAFTGFETAAVFAETNRDPRRTVAVGTYLTVFLVAAAGAASAWSLGVTAGPGQVVAESAATAVPELPFRLAETRLPAAAVTAGAALLLLSLLAALVAWQAVVARYVYALRRERVQLGTLAGRGGGGRVASTVALATLGLAGIVAGAVLRIDPIRYFFSVGVSGAYGVLFLLLLTSLAVVAYFGRNARGENMVRRLLAPALATALLGGVAVMAAGEFGRLVGLDGRSGWVIPAVAPALAVLGVVWALVVRGRMPHRYEAIGLGPNSVTGLAVQDRVTPRPYAATHSLSPTSSAPTSSPSGSVPPPAARTWGT